VRRLVRVVIVLLSLGVAWFALEMLAAESGEVVVLTTRDAGGEPHDTRLWVVDLEGRAWLRAGSEVASWYARLAARPEVEVTRAGVAGRYRAVPAPGARDRVNALMREKYGLADRWIGFWFDRSDAIPIRLEPLDGDGAARAPR
jgi:hypothetical protein